MGKYITKRLLLLIPTLFLVCVIVFLLLRCIPGSAVEALTYRLQSSGAVEVSEEAVRAQLGMDKPAPVQFLIWFGNALRGNLGDSFFQNESVVHAMSRQIVPSLELGFLTLVLTCVISIPLGVYCAARQDTISDYTIRTVSLVLMSLPVFWIATIVLIYPAIYLHWSPPTEYVSFFKDPVANLQMFITPALLGAITNAGMQLRYVRTVMLDTMRTDYVRTAKAKGVPERVILFRHSFRNAMIPVVTLIGGSVAMLIGGSVILENLFSIPGIGQQMVVALANRDYPIVQGCVLIFSLFTMIVNVVVDISYKWIDPRVSLE